MLNTTLIVINLLTILLSDDQQARISYIQEVIPNSLSELSSQSTNALIKVRELFDDVYDHIQSISLILVIVNVTSSFDQVSEVLLFN